MKKAILWTTWFTSCAVILLTTVFLLNNFLYIHKPMNLAVRNSITTYSENKNGSTSYGSGVVFVHSSGKTFAWTCFHVLRNNVSMDLQLDVEKKKFITKLNCNDIEVYQDLFNNEPRKVGCVTFKAKIVRFNSKDDIALLELPSEYWTQGVKFPLAVAYDVPVGAKIFHVGSFGGQNGENSVSEGVVGQRGFMLDGKVYDRIGTGFQPGSSGGGIFEANTGICVGLIARQINEKSHNQGYMIPYRRMREFATRLECLWALERNTYLPEDYLSILTDDVWEVSNSLREYLENQK